MVFPRNDNFTFSNSTCNGRDSLGTDDVRDCLEAALRNNPGSRMAVTFGRGIAQEEDVAFEWRVDRALEEKFADV